MYGIKAGVGHFSYTGSDYRDWLTSNNLQDALKLGFATGLYVSFEIIEFLFIQPELLLLGTGDACTEDASVLGPYFGRVKYIDRITYAAVPIFLKMRFGKINIFTGPTVFLHLGNGKLSLKAEDDDLQYDLDIAGLSSVEYIDGVFSTFTFAAAAGVELELPIRRRGRIITLEARGHYVFTNVLDESQGSVFQAYGVMILAGFGINARGRELRKSRVH